MSNKDLLKQAIAEAKTIREAAIANAKEALEETLTPHLKEMLAQKLQEMEEDEDTMEETINGAEAQDFSENPSKKGNLEEAEEEEAPEEEAEEETEEVEEEEELEIEDMSVEDLKDLIRDIVAQEVGHDESEEELPGEEAPAGEDDMVSMDGDSEEIDINELLAELEGMDKKSTEEGELSEMIEPGFGELTLQLMKMVPDLSMMAADLIIGLTGVTSIAGLGKVVTKAKEIAKTKAADSVGQATDGEMEEGLKDAIKGAAKKVGSAFEKGYDAVANADPLPGTEKLADKIKAGGKFLKKHGYNFGGNHSISEDLNEALETINVLKNQLQEVNLLNAKLLYVNKVFKSNNLSEGQKVNVIAAFDKAETVKEVKLVFETVSKNVVVKPTAIKEHKSFASKATGNAQTTAPKEILSEVSEQVSRWQKLAGIIK